MTRLSWWAMLSVTLVAGPAYAQTAPPSPSGDAVAFTALARRAAALFQADTDPTRLDQQQAPKTKERKGLRLVWDDRPSLRVGGAVRVDLRVKLQNDFRVSEWKGLEDEGGLFEFPRKRVGVQGEITNYVEFEIEAELRRENRWRDVFANVKPASGLEVKVGKFKMPFSYDQLTGPTALDFVHRSLIATTIAPARDIGVMVHGRLFRRVLTYEVGAFQNDGENVRLEDGFLLPGEEPPPNERAAALRVTVEPFRRASVPEALERLHVAVAFTAIDVAEGLNSLYGRNVLGYTYFEPVYTLGRRWRVGTELVWMPGPFSVKSEYARSDEERQRQGLGDVDLSDFIASGWYVSGTWAMTGESKSGGIEPRQPLFRGGFGAVELAVRYEELGFGSELQEGEAFASPRADPILENRDRVWTVGANWYPNKWVKIQVNGVRESFKNREHSPIYGQSTIWSGVCRLQFVM